MYEYLSICRSIDPPIHRSIDLSIYLPTVSTASTVSTVSTLSTPSIYLPSVSTLSICLSVCVCIYIYIYIYTYIIYTSNHIWWYVHDDTWWCMMVCFFCQCLNSTYPAFEVPKLAHLASTAEKRKSKSFEFNSGTCQRKLA